VAVVWNIEEAGEAARGSDDLEVVGDVRVALSSGVTEVMPAR
jgi:hypothetical protein